MRITMWDKLHRFYCGKVINDMLYFSNLEFNGLFKMDLSTGITEFVDFFDDEPLDAKRLHRKVLLSGKNIIFLPQWGNKIHIYNMSNKEQKSIIVPQETKGKAIADGAVTNEGVLLFPMKCGQLFYRLDTTKGILYEDTLFNSWLAEYDSFEKQYQFSRIAVKKDQVWAAVYGSNIICCFDLLSKKVKTYETELKDIQGVYNAEDGLWVSCLEDTNIYHWRTDESIEIYLNNDILKDEEVYAQIIEFQDQVYVLPSHSKNIFAIEGDSLKKVNFPRSIQFIKEEEYSFFGYDISDETLWILPYAANMALAISNNMISSFHIEFDRNDSMYLNGLGKRAKENKGCLVEHKRLNAEAFIGLVVNNNAWSYERTAPIGIGKNIWQTLCR